MNKIKSFLLVLGLLLFLYSYSQAQISLEGKWNIVSIESNEYFYDFKKDSFRLKIDDLFGTDIKRQNEFKLTTKMAFGSLYYRFNETGQYLLCMPGLVRDSGDYKLNTVTRQIEFQTKEPGVEADIYQYQLSSQGLRLKMPVSGSYMEMFFKKE